MTNAMQTFNLSIVIEINDIILWINERIVKLHLSQILNIRNFSNIYIYIRCNEIYSSSDAFLHSIWFYDQKKDDKLIITFFDLYFRKRISSIKFLSPSFIL